MRARSTALLIALLPLAFACAPRPAPAVPVPVVNSRAGTVPHGEVIPVPSGTVDDWSIIVAPTQMGAEEPGSETDNRLLRFRAYATALNPGAWQITALYRFAYADNDSSVHWVEGSASYLMVRK